MILIGLPQTELQDTECPLDGGDGNVGQVGLAAGLCQRRKEQDDGSHSQEVAWEVRLGRG